MCDQVVVCQILVFNVRVASSADTMRTMRVRASLTAYRLASLRESMRCSRAVRSVAVLGECMYLVSRVYAGLWCTIVAFGELGSRNECALVRNQRERV